MGIHYVERSFELRGPSGLGGSPRPDLIGGVLSGLQETLIDSVRMGFLHASRTRGRTPQMLKDAADAIRFTGAKTKREAVEKTEPEVAWMERMVRTAKLRFDEKDVLQY